jgi:hemerythrin
MNNWDDKYLLDIPIIDEQHRGFFILLKDELSRNINPTKEQMIELITRLENYIMDHFSSEELLMEKSGYDDLANHKNQHVFFIQKVDEMKIELLYQNPLLYSKMIDFMKKWFLTHILIVDKKFQTTVQDYLLASGTLDKK